MTTDLVRRAGRGRRADGALVIWTVAEGRKGRRWREVVERDGSVVHTLLYETGPDRRFTHLELASAAGLATLHPEGDGTLHGNVVRADGIEHVLGVPLRIDHGVGVRGSVVAAAAVAWSGVGQDGLVLDASTLRLVPGAIELVDIDADGLPALSDGDGWPLESDPPR